MHHRGWIVWAAAGVVAMAACGGSSQPSTPTAQPTPDTIVAAGTVLDVASGETGEPIAGAQVVVAGRRYDTNSGGQVSLVDPVPYGATVDVIAPSFFDRQTLLRKNGTRRFVLWPRTTPWGLNQDYTAELVYTLASADSPPLGSSPLERIRQGTREVVVVLSEEILQNERAHESHQYAVGHINAALGGKISYVLSPSRPSTGVIVEAQINAGDPLCADRVLGYALMSYRSGEIIGGTVNYCTQQLLSTALISHELGHTTGLNHSPDSRDLMYRFIRPGLERLTRLESLTLSMLFERPGGNRFPDNDRDVAAASSGQRLTVCN